jgi:glutathione reductase (NADPH)
VRLGIPGEEHLVTSEEFLSLDRLPGRMVLVGGGYIAAEFSHLAARAGASVTVLQRGKRMLVRFDPDLVGWLMDVFRRLRIDVRTQAAVTGVDKKGDSFRVRASVAGAETHFDADLVVHSAGRAPDFSAMHLAAAGVATEKNRLKLNEFLQSVSNPAVYAAGDAAQMGPPLTPVSGHDAKIAVANMLEGNHAKPNYAGVPSVAFTIPPIASAGMSEAKARESGLKLRVKSEKASDWFTAIQAAEPTYGFKTIVDETSGRVLGAHVVGPHADEVINVFGLAIRNGLTADALRNAIFAYPTAASDIGYML